MERQFSHSLELSILDERAIGPWNVHRILITDSLSGWMDYMAWLEDAIREQVSCILLEEDGMSTNGFREWIVKPHSLRQSRRRKRESLSTDRLQYQLR